MKVNIIPNEELKELINKVKAIEDKLDQIIAKDPLNDKWLTIPEVCELLKISPRTLQNYRDNGLISFSQIGSKIYFKARDIQEYLEKHYIKGFKTDKNDKK